MASFVAPHFKFKFNFLVTFTSPKDKREFSFLETIKISTTVRNQNSHHLFLYFPYKD